MDSRSTSVVARVFATLNQLRDTRLEVSAGSYTSRFPLNKFLIPTGDVFGSLSHLTNSPFYKEIHYAFIEAAGDERVVYSQISNVIISGGYEIIEPEFEYGFLYNPQSNVRFLAKDDLLCEVIIDPQGVMCVVTIIIKELLQPYRRLTDDTQGDAVSLPAIEMPAKSRILPILVSRNAEQSSSRVRIETQLNIDELSGYISESLVRQGYGVLYEGRYNGVSFIMSCRNDEYTVIRISGESIYEVTIESKKTR